MLTIETAERYHDISCGHRVVGHESKCKLFHGHNYRVTFFLQAASLDAVGRVLDFSIIKDKLCNYLEDSWDHRFLMWSEDPLLKKFLPVDLDLGSLRIVPFNPTAENMAKYLLAHVGPQQLADHPQVKLVKVTVEETRKCSASSTFA